MSGQGWTAIICSAIGIASSIISISMGKYLIGTAVIISLIIFLIVIITKLLIRNNYLNATIMGVCNESYRRLIQCLYNDRKITKDMRFDKIERYITIEGDDVSRKIIASGTCLSNKGVQHVYHSVCNEDAINSFEDLNFYGYDLRVDTERRKKIKGISKTNDTHQDTFFNIEMQLAKPLNRNDSFCYEVNWTCPGCVKKEEDFVIVCQSYKHNNFKNRENNRVDLHFKDRCPEIVSVSVERDHRIIQHYTLDKFSSEEDTGGNGGIFYDTLKHSNLDVAYKYTFVRSK